MAIMQILLAAIARSAGRILNTAVGWATTMIFGRVPEKRQIYVSVMMFWSSIRTAVLVGIAFPSAGTFLLSFVPLPTWVDRKWVRLAMTIAAAVLPALVGGSRCSYSDPDERPAGAARVRAVLRGYPFTVGLAVTLSMMCVLAPVMKLQTLARRWGSQHIPVVVDSEDYDDVLEQVQRVLATGGWRTDRRLASWMVRLPTRVLTLLAGRTLDDYVAKQLTTLRAERFEVVLHPSDLVLSGEEGVVVHARAVLAEQLAFGKAHLTWTKDAQALEDHMRRLHRSRASCRGRIRTTACRRARASPRLRRFATQGHRRDVRGVGGPFSAEAVAASRRADEHVRRHLRTGCVRFDKRRGPCPPATSASRMLFPAKGTGSVIGFDHFSRPHLLAGVDNFDVREKP